jgi:predicted acetyltransferase
MEAADSVTLQLATRADETPLANLLELYLHDMSEAFPMRISEEGRFGYAWLPTYWAEPERRSAYFIRKDGGLAGFVLVTCGSPANPEPEPGVLDVAEFFVLRRYRRHGVGRAAIHQLWDMRPSHWFARVSEGNATGLAFWPKAVSTYGVPFHEKRTPGRHFPWRVFDLHTGRAR